MTQTFTVRCQNCGAALQIGDDIRFITCAYCHSELEIVRDESTIHTQVLKEVVGELETMRAKVRTLEIQREIDLLDREWETQRETFMIRGKDGGAYEPTADRGIALIATGCVVVMLLVGVSLSSSKGIHGPDCFGFLIGIIFAVAGASNISKAKALTAARKGYEKQREALVQKLNSSGD